MNPTGQNDAVRILAIRGAAWNYVGTITRATVQVAVQVVFARILGPESFGHFALAIIIIGIGSLITEMGFGAALVQKRLISEFDIQHAHTLAVSTGLALMALTYSQADALAGMLNNPSVAALLRALAPALFLQSLIVAPFALLKRDLQFRTIQLVQTVSYVSSFLFVGVGMALVGAGIWSMVAAWLANTLFLAGILNYMRPLSMVPRFRGTDGTVRAFGYKALSTNLANWLVENLDNFLVGRIFGAAALGEYAASYNLVRSPANQIVIALQSALFAASSRSQDSKTGLQKAYLSVTSAISLVSAPLFFGVAVCSDTIILALFGPAWLGSSQLLAPLALAMFAHSLMAISGPLIWGTGRVVVELGIQACTVVVLASGVLWASTQTVQIVAWTVFSVYVVRYVAMTVAVMRVVGINGRAVATALRGGVIAAIVTSAVLLILDRSMESLAPMLRLLCDVGVAVGIVLLGVYFAPGLLISPWLADVFLLLLGNEKCRRVRLLSAWMSRVVIAINSQRTN